MPNYQVRMRILIEILKLIKFVFNLILKNLYVLGPNI